MKRFYKIFASWFLCLFLVLSQFIVSLADVNSLMISSDSNALMTLELDDSDYTVIPMSSIGSVVNTVDLTQAYVSFWVVNPDTGQGISIVKMGAVNDNKLSVKLLDSDILDGYYLSNIGLTLRGLNRNALPPPGRYNFSFDLSNQFSYSLNNAQIIATKSIDNADTVLQSDDITSYTSFSSGEAYCSGVVVDLMNVTSFYVDLRVQDYALQKVRYFDGAASFRFELTSDSADVTVGIEQNSQDYQSGVSSSLSDLSSSVDTMTDEISGVTEAIQNLQGAMEPHYSNVLTQLHHITEQLHALWDQQFNLHHVPLMAKLDEIKSAIANMDLEVVVELDELKQTVNNMSTAIQNKLQSVQEAITNGFNNQGINQDAAELDQSLQEYEEAEQTVLDQVNDSLNDFEFDSGFDEYKTTISVFSDFLQDLYDSSGGFKVVINLSLMLSIAGIVIGVYRFRDGG